jgi:hypothetical protein
LLHEGLGRQLHDAKDGPAADHPVDNLGQQLVACMAGWGREVREGYKKRRYKHAVRMSGERSEMHLNPQPGWLCSYQQYVKMTVIFTVTVRPLGALHSRLWQHNMSQWFEQKQSLDFNSLSHSGLVEGGGAKYQGLLAYCMPHIGCLATWLASKIS